MDIVFSQPPDARPGLAQALGYLVLAEDACGRSDRDHDVHRRVADAVDELIKSGVTTVALIDDNQESLLELLDLVRGTDLPVEDVETHLSTMNEALAVSADLLNQLVSLDRRSRDLEGSLHACGLGALASNVGKTVDELRRALTANAESIEEVIDELEARAAELDDDGGELESWATTKRALEG